MYAGRRPTPGSAAIPACDSRDTKVPVRAGNCPDVLIAGLYADRRSAPIPFSMSCTLRWGCPGLESDGCLWWGDCSAGGVLGVVAFEDFEGGVEGD